MRARTFLISAAALVAVAAAFAGCGSGGSSGGQTAASGSTQPKVVSGPLRLFAYSDGFDKQLIQPFETENPKVQLQTTPFDSVASATAKLRPDTTPTSSTRASRRARPPR